MINCDSKLKPIGNVECKEESHDNGLTLSGDQVILYGLNMGKIIKDVRTKDGWMLETNKGFTLTV